MSANNGSLTEAFKSLVDGKAGSELQFFNRLRQVLRPLAIELMKDNADLCSRLDYSDLLQEALLIVSTDQAALSQKTKYKSRLTAFFKNVGTNDMRDALRKHLALRRHPNREQGTSEWQGNSDPCAAVDDLSDMI